MRAVQPPSALGGGLQLIDSYCPIGQDHSGSEERFISTGVAANAHGLKLDAANVNLSQEELREASRKAFNARWEAYYAAHPEKLQAKLERVARKGTRPRGRPSKEKAKN